MAVVMYCHRDASMSIDLPPRKAGTPRRQEEVPVPGFPRGLALFGQRT